MTGIGMLSCGHVHTKGYCKNVADRDDAKLVAVWDDMPKRGRAFADEYGAEFMGDLSAAVAREDVDGFIICSENTRHLPLLTEAIPAGKPIFCEKPFTTTTSDAAEALALIRKHGAKVMMGYVQPFTAAVRGAAKLLAEGALGEVTRARFVNAHHAAYGRWFDSAEVAWFADPDLAGGGAFMDMGTHAVHAIRTLLGPVRRVLASIRNVSGVYSKVDDCGIALLEHESGAVSTCEASWVRTGGPTGLEITGSTATLFPDGKGGFLYAAPEESAKPVEPGQAAPTQVDRLIATIRGEVSDKDLSDDLACSADAVAIVEACYESSQAGAWKEVKRL